VQEREGKTLEAIGIGIAIGNDFLSRTQLTRQLRERINYIKLKSFCTTKERVSKLKRLSIEWEKSLPAICQTRDW
jgi:hypothetical protein